MPAHDKLAHSGRADTSSIPHHAVCDDCGAIMADWIETLDGSILCLACADHWEPYLEESVALA